jgi:hypothetical protein
MFRARASRRSLSSAGEVLLCSCGDGRIDPCCDPGAHPAGGPAGSGAQPIRVVTPSAFVVARMEPVR